MLPDETKKRQELLGKEIYLLSERLLDVEKEEQIKAIQDFQKIYSDGFKHSYSDLFPIIVKVFDSKNIYNKDYLMSNLQKMKETLEDDILNESNQYVDIYQLFIKLCDHLNLQISEMSVFSKMESKVSEAMEQVVNIYEHVKEEKVELNIVNNKLLETSERAKSLQTELITVLSIFAAIVITFSGGISFLGSAMTSINNALHYECVVLVVLICGLVIFNTIFLMMYLVSKITRRDIYAACETKDCSCKDDDGKKCKCNGIKRIMKRLPYVFYFNLLSLIGIIIDMIVWIIDIKDFWIL